MRKQTMSDDRQPNRRRPRAWDGFKPGLWQKEINVRDFIQQNYTPYDGDESFLAPATERTKKLWEKLNELFVEERKKGVLDVSQIPSSITAHAPGYIDTRERDHRRPADRRAAEAGDHAQRRLAHGRSLRSRPTATSRTRTSSRRSPSTARRTTKACSTPTPPTFGRCRSSHILTGLPDAYGRGRIIGDYRRVAALRRGAADRAQGGGEAAPRRGDVHRGDHPRPRGTERADPRAQGTAADGGELRVRHLRPGPQRARGGAVAVLRLPGGRQGAERRGDVAGPHLDVPRHLLRARPRGGHAHRGSRRRRSSTTSSSSCASSASCARRSTTSCSPATRPG